MAITQYEIRKFMRMQRIAKAFEKLKETIKPRMVDKEPQEVGALTMLMMMAPSTSTAYKVAIDRIKELHPELAGAVTKIVEANTKPTTQHIITVQPT